MAEVERLPPSFQRRKERPMTAADAITMHCSLWQAISFGVAVALFTGGVLGACCFVGVLVMEHFRTWRKRPAYRAALASSISRSF